MFSHIVLLKITSQNDHGQRNCLHLQTWTAELDLSISKQYFHNNTMFWYFYTTPTQPAARKQMSAKLEEIFATARARIWESGRRGDGGGGRKVA